MRPEHVVRAVHRGALTGAVGLVPDRAWGAHHWAAHAFAGLVAPDHHVGALLGHAEAGAFGVVPEFVGGTRCVRDADPCAVISAEVGVFGIRW